MLGLDDIANNSDPLSGKDHRFETELHRLDPRARAPIVLDLLGEQGPEHLTIHNRSAELGLYGVVEVVVQLVPIPCGAGVHDKAGLAHVSGEAAHLFAGLREVLHHSS